MGKRALGHSVVLSADLLTQIEGWCLMTPSFSCFDFSRTFPSLLCQTKFKLLNTLDGI